jgi:hypothetical protein
VASEWKQPPLRYSSVTPSAQMQQCQLDRVVGGWMAEQQSASATAERGAVAVDGKTVPEAPSNGCTRYSTAGSYG